MSQKGKLTPKQRKFLTVYGLCGNVSKACREVKVCRVMVYYWINNNPIFKEAFDNAQEEAADHLEEEARRRAVDGVDEPVYYMGQEVGTVKKYSDAILVRLLMAYRSEKFRDRQVNHTGQLDHNHKHGHIHVKVKTTDNDLSKYPVELLEEMLRVKEKEEAFLESLKQLPAPKESDEKGTELPEQGQIDGVVGSESPTGTEEETPEDDQDGISDR